ncbi:MAG: hypothetical protein K0R06_1399 [Clostridium sp.]|jgi:hypothetical protein|nr:hypothetical protein [Clostridium sp.]
MNNTKKWLIYVIYTNIILNKFINALTFYKPSVSILFATNCKIEYVSIYS